MGKTVKEDYVRPEMVIKLAIRIDHAERIIRDMQLGEDYVMAEAVHMETRGDTEKGKLLRELGKSVREDIASVQVLLQLAKSRINGIERNGSDD